MKNLGLESYGFNTKNMNDLLDAITGNFTRLTTGNYPPFNVVKDGNATKIEIAVAGFDQSELSIEVEDTHYGRVLTVKGVHKDEAKAEYLFRGLSERSFTRSFSINKFDISSTELVNGVLSIRLVTVESDKRTRTIPIGYGAKKEFLTENEKTKETFR
jgi:molecular chaperone IbpA